MGDNLKPVQVMEDNLKPVPINELSNKQFFIPHYQRGFRWIDLQVKQFLDDIDCFIPREIPGKEDERTFYCLQPVVVKLMDDNSKSEHNLAGEWYEVIDGQQRLTTIFIIVQYMNQKWIGEEKLAQFRLNYETRPGCVQFLQNLKVNADDSVDIDKSYIDYFHISAALKAIRLWHQNYQEEKGKKLNTSKFQSTLEFYAKVIWYKVSPNENSKALFERLNLGKIPLTNAELTKALFLSSESFKGILGEERKIKQFEIARLWDEMEHKLNEPDLKFWSFITNSKREHYETKIDLILDLISGKADDEKDPFYTFFTFTEKQKNGNLITVWKEIEHFYYTLLEWYINKNYYHKIGYLIASKPFGNYNGIDLSQLVKDSMAKTKKDFLDQIDGLIKDSVKVELSELRYEPHYNQIFNVLLLFNVETNRSSDAISEFYPFKQHKDRKWSLEHIHARKSDNFEKTKKDPWLKWLELHLPILEEMKANTQKEDEREKIQVCINNINRYNNDQLTWERFSQLFKEVNDLFTLDPESMDRDSEGIVNLALLSQPDNSALNNSVFEIKRREIIRLDKEGNFIPVCTRRGFMKYYNEAGLNTQQYYWSESDREKYSNALKKTLENYLPENHIEIEADENE
jgi:uncharacterized protein with ParB-like and HNH nuclease domain